MNDEQALREIDCWNKVAAEELEYALSTGDIDHPMHPEYVSPFAASDSFVGPLPPFDDSIPF